MAVFNTFFILLNELNKYEEKERKVPFWVTTGKKFAGLGSEKWQNQKVKTAVPEVLYKMIFVLYYAVK